MSRIVTGKEPPSRLIMRAQLSERAGEAVSGMGLPALNAVQLRSSDRADRHDRGAAAEPPARSMLTAAEPLTHTVRNGAPVNLLCFALVLYFTLDPVTIALAARMPVTAQRT